MSLIERGGEVHDAGPHATIAAAGGWESALRGGGQPTTHLGNVAVLSAIRNGRPVRARRGGGQGVSMGERCRRGTLRGCDPTVGLHALTIFLCVDPISLLFAVMKGSCGAHSACPVGGFGRNVVRGNVTNLNRVDPLLG